MQTRHRNIACRHPRLAAALLAACGLAVTLAVPAVSIAQEGQPDEMIQREIRQLRNSLEDLEARALEVRISIAEADDGDERARLQDELFGIESEIETVRESIIRRGGDPDAAAQPAPAQPARPGVDRRAEALAALQQAEAQEGMVEIGPFSEPVDIMRLVEFVQQLLDLNLMVVDPGLEGQQVVIRTPISVPEEGLLDFLVLLLEQKGYTLVPDRGVYLIVQSVNPPAGPATTQIIPTQGLRPSQVAQLMSSIVAQSGRIQPLDEMGALLVTATPRQIGLVNDLLNDLVAKASEVQWFRFDLKHVTADIARQRILELLDPARGAPRTPVPGQQADPRSAVAVTASVVDLPQRLTVDSQSNALIFKGRPDEQLMLEDLLKVVDQPSELVTRWYEVSMETATKMVNAGQREGLGRVVYEDAVGQQPAFRSVRAPQLQNQFDTTGGPAFIIYPDASGFMYYGTETQHQRIEQLMYQFEGIESGDTIVYEFYKLKHSDAAEVAALIQDLISSQGQAGNRGLVGSDLSRRGELTPPPQTPQPEPQVQSPAAGGLEAQIGAILPTEDINVLADEFNNQIIVKAPSRLQPVFARIIEKIDLRRPQVYLEAMIVTVTHDDTFNWSVDTQGVFGQFGIQSVFGLTSASEGATLLDPRQAGTGFRGLTAALIRSDSVPFVLNVLASDADTRIVASPQVLVDDNETATILSQEGQPTTSISQGTTTDVTSFQGFEEAGPELTITPHISEGGYVRLEFAATLSSFIGESPSPGIPPPRLENSIETSSVRVPSDSTIIVGGLSFETTSDTVFKVPILGDIPLLGLAFQDIRKNNSTTTLYVFITPRIMRDDHFLGEILNTAEPIAAAGVEPAGPPPPTIARMRLRSHDRLADEVEETLMRYGDTGE